MTESFRCHMKLCVVGALFTLLLVANGGCIKAAPSAPVDVAPPALPPTAAVVPADGFQDTAPPSDSVPAHPIFNSCVLHAGDASVRRRQPLLPDGSLGPETTLASCSFSAECVQVKRRVTPGDGFVSMNCHHESCVCSFDPMAPKDAATSFSFQADEACASGEVAERLFRRWCLSGSEKGRWPSRQGAASWKLRGGSASATSHGHRGGRAWRRPAQNP